MKGDNMSENEQKTPEEISQHLTDEKHKLEGSKLFSKIEEFQSDLNAQIQTIKNEMRNLITSRTHHDERNSKLHAEFHQIGELVQKLENAQQHTKKLVSQQEKEIEKNRQQIQQFEKELQKVKSMLRID